MEYKVNDLFCGCGGLGLGFKQAGFTTVGAWDYDKWAVMTYKENVDQIVGQADITKMISNDLPKADVWTFGFPCQDLSVAGKQVGLFEGKRSGLFFEVMRLLEETRSTNPGNLPVIIMAENVKGLRPYLPVLEAEYKKQGYTAHVQKYNSKYWGVPQNRERYFIVGTRDDLELEFNFPVQQVDFVPRLSTILEDNVEEKYYISDDKAEKIIAQALLKLEKLGTVHATITPDRVDKRQNGRRAKEEEEEMFTLTAQDLHGVIIDDTFGYDGVRTYDENSPTLRSSRQGLKVIEEMKDVELHGTAIKARNNFGKCPIWGEQTPTLLASDYKEPNMVVVEPQINVVGMLDISSHDHSRRVHDPEGLSPTVTAVAGGTHHIKIFDPKSYRVRKLTPTEYGRLQGFPMDTWKQVVSNSQAYKQFGNAVTVNVAKAIAEAIKEIL